MSERKLHFETLQLHAGQEQPDAATGARAVPIYQSASFVFQNSADAAARFSLEQPGEIYTRLGNPTQNVFEQRMAALEGGVAAVAVASGAAAITYALLNLTRQGDHIVAARTIYGGSYNLLAHTLPAYGVTATFVDPSDVQNFEAAGTAAFAVRIRTTLLRDTGAALSPFNSFLLLQGLETLSLRVERHVQNALRVVDFLQAHPKVRCVNHPSLPAHPDHALYTRYFPQGAGSIFTIELEGGQAEAHRFIDRLKLFSLLANVADAKSLVIHPASTTHSQLTPEECAQQGITPGTVRLSIGLEHIDDLLDDLRQALDAI